MTETKPSLPGRRTIEQPDLNGDLEGGLEHGGGYNPLLSPLSTTHVSPDRAIQSHPMTCLP